MTKSIELAETVVGALSPLVSLLRIPRSEAVILWVRTFRLTLSGTEVRFASGERAAGWNLTISERDHGELMRLNWSAASIDVVTFRQGKWPGRLEAALPISSIGAGFADFNFARQAEHEVSLGRLSVDQTHAARHFSDTLRAMNIR